MTDAATSDTIRACQVNELALRHLERWYETHCRPVAEVSIVPLTAGPSVPAHLHAVLVPDFALLRQSGQVNSRELLRFEFQETSKQLPAGERPQTFSVRATPLPRTANGEPDHELLRAELSEAFFNPGKIAPASDTSGTDETVRNAVLRLIREFRLSACPEICIDREANLELDLDFDSLDRILLICSIEKTFGLAIPPEEAARIFTVGDLIDSITAAVTATRGPTISPAHVSWPGLLERPLNEREHKLADSILQERPALSFAAWGAARLLCIFAARRFNFRVKFLGIGGLEWLPPRGAFLLAANHCSHLDPLFLLWSLPFRFAHRLSFMGHTEYFGSGWKAALARRLKLVPVDPDEHALPGLKLCAEALRRGFIGAVFPEGERSPDGMQHRFHRGIALLAMHLQVPIVPVAISGTYDVFPRQGRRIHAAPVEVSFGPPLLCELMESEENLLARVWTAVWRLRGTDAHSREPMPRPLEPCGKMS